MPRSTRVFRLILLSCIFVLFLAAAGFAQYGASLQGTVADGTGAVVPGATVSVTNQDTGVVYPSVTGDTGLYRVSGLVPGRYTVKVEVANFKAKSVANIYVAAEETKNQDVTLDVGATSESVTVTANAYALPNRGRQCHRIHYGTGYPAPTAGGTRSL